ncbi:MAG: 2-oxoisovalerate dehydrogenase [Actinobacteria bacterium]|nr:2-oxoisovalerate dehydrogenase [Actinomycetota bacterium]
MDEIIFVVKESEEGGFEARALDYSIFTEAEDMESLKEAVKDSVICHFDKKNTPKIIRLHLVKDELITV